jgi:hypothetical protein
MPSARAGRATPRAGSRLGHPATIAIASARITPASACRPPFGERLVAFARRNQERFAVASLILATLLGCYFAFQMGRGL